MHKYQSVYLSLCNHSKCKYGFSKCCCSRQCANVMLCESFHCFLLFFSKLTFKSHMDTSSWICFIGNRNIDIMLTQYITNSIFTSTWKCKVIICHFRTRNDAWNIICGETHILLFIKFGISESRYTFEGIHTFCR